MFCPRGCPSHCGWLLKWVPTICWWALTSSPKSLRASPCLLDFACGFLLFLITQEMLLPTFHFAVNSSSSQIDIGKFPWEDCWFPVAVNTCIYDCNNPEFPQIILKKDIMHQAVSWVGSYKGNSFLISGSSPLMYWWKWSENCSVVSDSLRPHGLHNPWNSPSQNTGVGSHSLLQGIFPTQVSHIAGRFFTVWATREVLRDFRSGLFTEGQPGQRETKRD